MFPNEIIASKRKLIGYADFDIATKIGLNLSWYSDLEQYTDEILDNVNFTFVLKTLRILDLRASETFTKYIEDTSTDLNIANEVRLNDFLHRQRLFLGILKSSLSDEIGFDESVVDHIENESLGLFEYPFETIKSILRALQISLKSVLNWAEHQNDG